MSYEGGERRRSYDGVLSEIKTNVKNIHSRMERVVTEINSQDKRINNLEAVIKGASIAVWSILGLAGLVISILQLTK